ncbi:MULTISPECIES: YeeE/YedE thiosulfate transporter family protein [Reinekea]|jgi:uncharacterized membrane protein YedE/YeeE|uniref:Putative membrane protein n=1 Tax=Reinekea forsetii TaxID=1336806 RepID=A0A2K8KT06_9GAMM|nr:MULTISPECIES: YeeE/YedE thiosulfate transporter family protein [Reinekea]ATX77209.1 putative membrane protein [Reinekea forsetii]MDO7644198.1 YeeE/YedE family protein [Reinekea forsetii]
MEIINFTPGSAALGGALIGLSALLLLLTKGRIAGVSGIAGGIIYPVRGEILWRVVFVVGLILGGLIYQWLSGTSTTGLFKGIDHIQAAVSWPWLIVGGLLVGVGTTIGTGCTSGHGICGLARGTTRSLAATLSFVGAGLVTVFIVRQLVGV